MKIFEFIPVLLSLFLILGIIFGFYIQLNTMFVSLILLVSFIIIRVSFYFANKSFTKNLHFTFSTILLFFVIGVTTVTFQNKKLRKNHYSNFISNENSTVLIISKQLKSNLYYNKYVADVTQINKHKTIGKVLLNIQKDSLYNLLNVNDKLYVFNNFRIVNEPKNLYQFNYKKYLEKQQIHHQINCSNNEFKLLKNTGFSINSFTANFRNKINNKLKKYNFSTNELAIINALLLGQRQNMSKELIESYQGAGAVHILAVSGLHIGVLLFLLEFLLKPLLKLKNGKTLRLLIILLLLWLFAFVAGLSASVVRAVTMYSAIAIGLLSNRKSSTLNNLFISMFILLLIHPLYIFSVGFQLSYLAVFSIVYFYPKFIAFYNPKSFFIKKYWQLFAVSCSAQLGILPLSLYYFHQFPSLFFISSMVIIPFLGVILGIGILIICLASFDLLPQILATSYGFIINCMNNFIAFIAKQESFLFKKISFSVLLLIVSYFLIVFFFRWLDKKTIKRFVYVLIGIVGLQSVFIYQKYQLETKNEFIIFNKNRHTVMAKKLGRNLQVFHNLDNLKPIYSIKSYHIKQGNLNITKNNLVQNIYNISNKKILVIDSLGVYDVDFSPKIIFLRQSPKINLERLIDKLKPNIIIADASNYKSDVEFWKKTCVNKSIKFHSTYNDKAIVIN